MFVDVRQLYVHVDRLPSQVATDRNDYSSVDWKVVIGITYLRRFRRHVMWLPTNQGQQHEGHNVDHEAGDLVDAVKHEAVPPKHGCRGDGSRGKNVIDFKPRVTKATLTTAEQKVKDDGSVYPIAKVQHEKMVICRTIREESVKQGHLKNNCSQIFTKKNEATNEYNYIFTEIML